MNKRNVEIYLKDIIQAMEAIENFVKDMDYEEVRNDDSPFWRVYEVSTYH